MTRLSFGLPGRAFDLHEPVPCHPQIAHAILTKGMEVDAEFLKPTIAVQRDERSALQSELSSGRFFHIADKIAATVSRNEHSEVIVRQLWPFSLSHSFGMFRVLRWMASELVSGTTRRKLMEIIQQSRLCLRINLSSAQKGTFTAVLRGQRIIAPWKPISTVASGWLKTPTWRSREAQRSG